MQRLRRKREFQPFFLKKVDYCKIDSFLSIHIDGISRDSHEINELINDGGISENRKMSPVEPSLLFIFNNLLNLSGQARQFIRRCIIRHTH